MEHMHQPLYANSSQNQSDKFKKISKKEKGKGLGFQIQNFRNTDKIS